MPAPITQPLDDFNTGAAQLLTARTGWSPTTLFGGPSMTTDATPTFAQASVAAQYASNYWATPFGAAQEVWAQLGGSADAYLFARLSVVNPITGYQLDLNSTGFIAIEAMVAGVQDHLVTSGTQAWVPGDSFGLVAIGSTLEVWYKAVAGSWALLLTTTDTFFSGGGWIGGNVSPPGSATLQSFGGGSLLPPRQAAGWSTSSGGR